MESPCVRRGVVDYVKANRLGIVRSIHSLFGHSHVNVNEWKETTTNLRIYIINHSIGGGLLGHTQLFIFVYLII